jgi:phosphoribosylglycinamide formyltransferase 1
MINIAVLGSSRGTSIDKSFEQIALGKLKAKVQVVISNKPDAYILERAKSYGFESICVPSKGKVRSVFDTDLLTELQKYELDLIILVGYMKILDAKFVQAYKGKIINVHPSLLPKFAGGMDGDVHRAVIEAGETESGCTVHLVDQGVDTGQILLQKSCLLGDGETPESLKTKVQKLESQALLEVIRDWDMFKTNAVNQQSLVSS